MLFDIVLKSEECDKMNDEFWEREFCLSYRKMKEYGNNTNSYQAMIRVHQSCFTQHESFTEKILLICLGILLRGVRSSWIT